MENTINTNGLSYGANISPTGSVTIQQNVITLSEPILGPEIELKLEDVDVVGGDKRLEDWMISMNFTDEQKQLIRDQKNKYLSLFK